MERLSQLQDLLRADPERRRIVALVHSLDLPDCWVAAGFARNAVWDFLHGRSPSLPSSDVDVIWFDPGSSDAAIDLQLEAHLKDMDGSIAWSVKNQARMHVRNDDPPYLSSGDAMRFWPETATAVAVRQTTSGDLEITAPFGLEDLYAARIRPTPRFSGEKHTLFTQRLESKKWLAHWPLLRAV
ncbi:MAG: nucleotidyltransferase family protein [Collimonas sp.]|uniref:nucleotidyltransferase family protein n=1 Tax=Collimonas sp. TaxID=1963772 RepID=UPI0032631556